jgi:hypothetical protein
MQLGVPPWLGGCGLPIPSLTLSAAAWLSSAALTQAALRQGPAIFRPFDGPHCAILQQTWETLKTTAADLCRHNIASATTKPSALMKPCFASPTVSPHHTDARACQSLQRCLSCSVSLARDLAHCTPGAPGRWCLPHRPTQLPRRD